MSKKPDPIGIGLEILEKILVVIGFIMTVLSLIFFSLPER